MRIKDESDCNPFGELISEIKVIPEHEVSFKGIYSIRFVGGSQLNVKEDVHNMVPNPNGFVECHMMEFGTYSVKKEGETCYSRVNAWRAVAKVRVNINQIQYIRPIEAKVVE